jgi:alkanesulfonate monooxygenase SsuD/methylene tetrahydromethanopterin reductase-like flavin-dependent oxidoreductase (luciferase family)
VFTLRFDMRAPTPGAPAVDLYRAALEMTAWSETRGGVAAIVCEHHGSSDGYLPSPMPMAAALAARTSQIAIMTAIITVPLYSPVRLAEEMCVLDILSNGRVSYVGGIGYREVEYEMHGVDFHRRGAIAEEHLTVLLQAKTGQPFEHQGRTIHVTPTPVTPGGPSVAWGGGSAPAARRAARFGLDFISESGDPGLRVAYEEECRAQGREPGSCMLPPRETASVVFVAEDVDRAWEELGPYLMHEVDMYAEWNSGGKEGISGISFATSVEELRAENRSHRILSVEEAIDLARTDGILLLHPLIGGIPPDIAWPYLRTVVEKVEPALAG